MVTESKDTAIWLRLSITTEQKQPPRQTSRIIQYFCFDTVLRRLILFGKWPLLTNKHAGHKKTIESQITRTRLWCTKAATGPKNLQMHRVIAVEGRPFPSPVAQLPGAEHLQGLIKFPRGTQHRLRSIIAGRNKWKKVLTFAERSVLIRSLGTIRHWVAEVLVRDTPVDFWTFKSR